jgi:CRP-like cAMP-binding protein
LKKLLDALAEVRSARKNLICQMSEFTASIRNRLLQQLDRQDAAALQSALQHIKLEYGKVLYQAGQPIEFVYFPLAGVISMVKTMSDGSAAEVATIGNEGMAGSPVLIRSRAGGTSVHVEVPGEALPMPARAFRETAGRSPPLQKLIQRFGFALFNQVTQVAACNHFHDVEQRTARWLLMVQDRMPSDSFPLTHEVLSLMLGVRRSSVTVAAGRLSHAGLIEYRRGQISITDRAGLEKRSCECYRAIWDEYDRALKAAD